MTHAAMLAVSMFIVAPMVGANDWSQDRYDATHQGSVPASRNTEFGPFQQEWWQGRVIAGVSSPPVLRDGVVYFGDNTGILHALDAENGDTIWTASTGKTSAITRSAAVGPSLVYAITSTGKLHAFDRKTGEPEPGYPIDTGTTDGSIMLSEDVIYLGLRSGTIKAYFASTRNLKWSFEIKGTIHDVSCGSGRIEGTPVIFEQQVMVGSTNKCFVSIDKASLGTLKPGNVLWVAKAEDSIRSTPAVDVVNRRVVYGDASGRMYSVPVGNAGEAAPRWFHQEPTVDGVGTEFKAAASIAPGIVVVASRSGKVIGLEPAFGRVLWTTALGGEIVGGPALANGYALLGSSDGMATMLTLNNGSIVDTRPGTASIENGPIISGSQGIWSSVDGALYSWGGQKPVRPDLSVATFTVPAMTVGAAATIQATVRNEGTLTTPATKLKFEAGTNILEEVNVPALDVGGEQTYTASYTPTASGPVTLRATIDPGRVIKESNEANNIKEVEATVRKPDVPTTSGPPPTTTPGPGAALLVVVLGMLGLMLARRRDRP